MGASVVTNPARAALLGDPQVRSQATYLASLSAARARSGDPSDPALRLLPSDFECVLPLDSSMSRVGATGSFGYATRVFKAVRRSDGCALAVRRIDGARGGKRDLAVALQQWQRVSHPNVVPLRAAFVWERARFFAHDFVPSALPASQLMAQNEGRCPPEPLLWRVATHLCLALRSIHEAGLAARTLQPSRVLLTESNTRVRLASCGVLDAIEATPGKSQEQLQQADMTSLGTTLLQLACCNPAAGRDVGGSLTAVSRNYSNGFFQFVSSLCGERPPPAAVLLTSSLAGQVVQIADAGLARGDQLEALAEAEAGGTRYARLLLKLMFVLDRPESAGNPAWGESGDRKMLSMFRSFVFHQVDESGRPVLSMGHVLSALSRLDMGDPTHKVAMSSADGATVISASLERVRSALENAYSVLKGRSADQQRRGPFVDRAGQPFPALSAAVGGAPIGPTRHSPAFPPMHAATGAVSTSMASTIARTALGGDARHQQPSAAAPMFRPAQMAGAPTPGMASRAPPPVAAAAAAEGAAGSGAPVFIPGVGLVRQ